MSDPAPALAVVLIVAEGVPSRALLPAAETLREFGVDAVELPGAPTDMFAQGAEANTSRWRAVIVASADASHPAAIARATPLPVVRVPWPDGTTSGLALLQDADGNLPGPADDGEPFATVAIGPAGARNAALFVVSVLALDDTRLRLAWEGFRAAQTEAVLRLAPPTLE